MKTAARAVGRLLLPHSATPFRLNGEGFEPLVHKGGRVGRGQPLVKGNPAAVEAAGKSPVSSVVVPEASAERLGAVAESGEVTAGGELFVWN